MTLLQGYLDTNRQTDEQNLRSVQQAGALQQILAAAGKAKRDAALREQVAANGGDLEATVKAAIAAGNFDAAKELAPLLENQRKARAQQVLTSLTPAQLQDPEVLDRLGASGTPGTAHFTAAAQRIRDAKATADLAGTMRTKPAIQPDPQEVAQAADQGTPPVAPVAAQPGAFGQLMQSPNSSIATSAKNLQAQFDAIKNPTAAQVKMFDDYRKELTARHDSYAQQEKLLQQRQDTKDTASAAGLLNDEDASFMAGQYLAGDRTVLQNLGRGNQGAENIVKLRRAIAQQAREQGATPRDVAAAIGEFEGFKSGQRALGTRQAQIEMAGNVTKQFAPLAIEASTNFDRTEFKTLNDVEKAALSRTSSPELRRFNFANTSLINAYARAINPTGVGTVTDKEHAREILDTGFSKGDYAAAVDQLNKEIDAELKAPSAVKREMRDRLITPPGADPTVAPPAAAPAAPTTPAPANAGSWTPEKEKRYQELLKKRGGS